MFKKFDHISTKKTDFVCTTCDFEFPIKKDFKVHISVLQHNQLEKTSYSECGIEDDIDHEEFIEDCNFCYTHMMLDSHQLNQRVLKRINLY